MAGNSGNSSAVYESRGGVRISVDVCNVDGANAIEHLVNSLDTHLGVVLASGYEYPGRYTRRDFGFVDPPIMIQGGDREARIEALNERGLVLIDPIADCLRGLDSVEEFEAGDDFVRCRVRKTLESFPEEERSRQPSFFSIMGACYNAHT